MFSKSLPTSANYGIPDSQDTTLHIPARAGARERSLLDGEKGISFGVQQERREHDFWCSECLAHKK